MAREVVDADFLISVGTIAFDPLMGYRGTNSVFYPGLSSADAMLRTHGQGHVELGPEEVRPLREIVDEIGWLLGNPFTVQVIPAASRGVSRVLAGVCEPVLAQGKKILSEQWIVEVDERPDIVVAAVDHEAGPHAWEQLGAAVEVARNVVARGGKIVILSDLNAELSQGLELIRSGQSARDAIRPLRKQAPPDLVLRHTIGGGGGLGSHLFAERAFGRNRRRTLFDSAFQRGRGSPALGRRQHLPVSGIGSIRLRGRPRGPHIRGCAGD